MEQIVYRGNLSSASFPFVSDNWGRTVIVPQSDNTFNRQVQKESTDEDADVGIPQLFYAHNVVPFAQGWQSVGYEQVLDSGLDVFTDIFLLRNAADEKVYLGISSSNALYINNGTGTGWMSKGTFAFSGKVTTAYVSGRTYIYFEGLGCYYYDVGTGTFVSVSLTGIDVSTAAGITGAFGYLIVWSNPVSGTTKTFDTTLDSYELTGVDTSGLVINQSVSGAGIPVGAYIVAISSGVSITLSEKATATATITASFEAISAGIAWSSTIDPTDFTPSLVTGAGGGAVEGAKGAISFCFPHTLGFIVYTTANAVAAVFTNNSRYPFNFRAIYASGGVSSLALIGFDATSGNHYAYTTSGLQLISISQAQTLFPSVTDFVSGKVFEDFDEATRILTRTILSATMQKRVNVISDRYLIISYGVTSLTHALIYDLSQKRWGKLKIPHISVFEYELTSAGITETPKQSIGFLQSNGIVKILDFNVHSEESNGVAIFGKYQYIRARNLFIDEVVLENIYNSDNFDLYIWSALEGKTIIETVPALLSSAESSNEYGALVEGANHSLVCMGQFSINTLQLTFHIGGKR